MDGLKPGDRGNAVGALQETLNARSPELELLVDKIYGTKTSAAVADYQTAANLPVTGNADDTTLTYILTNPLRNADTLARLLEGMRQ